MLLAAEVLAERSPLMAGAAPRVLAGQFKARFPLKDSHTDVGLALATARALGVPLFALGAVGQFCTAGLAKGLLAIRRSLLSCCSAGREGGCPAPGPHSCRRRGHVKIRPSEPSPAAATAREGGGIFDIVA